LAHHFLLFWTSLLAPDYASLPAFDHNFPQEERLPAHFEITIDQRSFFLYTDRRRAPNARRGSCGSQTKESNENAEGNGRQQHECSDAIP
jgi:hypothetical protein